MPKNVLCLAGQTRPFKIEFTYDFEPTEPLTNIRYIRDTLMPAVASYFRRWIRVRCLLFLSV